MTARTRFFYLFVLTNLAVAQPLLERASSQAEFLVAHNSTFVELLLLTTLLCFLLPLFPFVMELPVPRPIHFILTCLLASILLLSFLNKLTAPSGVLILIPAVLGGFAFAWLCFRYQAISQVIPLVALLTLIVPLSFWISPSVRTVLTQWEKPFMAPVSSRTPVVMVLFDEFPLVSLLDESGNIDDVRYPNFAKLARGTSWFRNTTTFSSLTEVSVPVMLSGMYSDEEKLPTLKDYPNNLFTLLGGSYEMHVNEEVTRLWPEKPYRSNTFLLLVKDLSAVWLHIVLPTTIAQRIPSVTDKWANFWSDSDENRRDIFQQFLNSIQPASQKPAFYFLHVMLPHKPWIYLPSGNEYRDYGSLAWGTSIHNRGKWIDQPDVVQQFWKRHLLQVGYVDLLIGKLLQKLQSAGLYDSCLLIITSDHGVAFLPGESLRKSTDLTLQDIAYVPLFIKLPGQHQGETVDRRFETIDLLPTIGDALQIKIPWQMAGRSALSSHDKNKERSRLRGDRVVRYKSDLSVDDENFKNRLMAFGARSPFSSFFSLPDSIPAPASRKYKFKLLNREAFDHVDLKSNSIPCFIPGFIQTNKDEELTVLVKINGKPRAITKTFPMRQHLLRFAALVPESSFRQGKNNVEVVVLQ